jgi:hypothetical protein
MARHYFHLTNGEDLVIDREGTRTRSRADVWLGARKVSNALMASAPDYRGWSDWLVCVHDSTGRQVTVVPVLPAVGAAESQVRAIRLPVRQRLDPTEACHAHP